MTSISAPIKDLLQVSASDSNLFLAHHYKTIKIDSYKAKPTKVKRRFDPFSLFFISPFLYSEITHLTEE